MRKLAVCVTFMNEKYRRQIDEAAAAAGFMAHYYDTQAALTPHIGDYEVIFGHPVPALLRQATGLRWLCSDFAGVEKYLDDAVWPRPDCLLSNGSGAYGPTISEHVIMVLLMLLRRMPEYQADLNRRLWTYHTPIRSIIGSRVVMLGTGDIGCNVARRLKALGASVTGVCRSGVSDEPAFDQVLPLSGLDNVLGTADALIMALPATPETEGILSRERIAMLPGGGLCGECGPGLRHRPGGPCGSTAGRAAGRHGSRRSGAGTTAGGPSPVGLSQHHHHSPCVRQHVPGPYLRHRCGYVLRRSGPVCCR